MIFYKSKVRRMPFLYVETYKHNSYYKVLTASVGEPEVPKTKNKIDNHVVPKGNEKIFESEDVVVSDIKDGAKLLIGGFDLCGVPENLINALIKRGSKDFVIVANDIGRDNRGIEQFINKYKIKRLITSYVGYNDELMKQYFNGELELELSPQGTLAERIRAGGAGIPAFYTSTAYGTIIHEGKYVIKYGKNKKPEIFGEPRKSAQFNGRGHLLEHAITADFALIKAWKADTSGNLVFRKSARNFNSVMSKAARVSIAEVEEIVPAGQLDPDHIHLPGIYVDRVIIGSSKKKCLMQRKSFYESTTLEINKVADRIARRAALELKHGMHANLGIGIPTLTINRIPKDVKVLIQSDNGILGLGPYNKDKVDTDIINGSSWPATIVSGASFFGSDESFAMSRGGHIDLIMLGAMQVSAKGDIANWIIPGRMMTGMGGAMDLISSKAPKVVVTMKHCAKNGSPKILPECTLPITGQQCVDLIITELGVFEVVKGLGLKLIEIAPGVDTSEIARVTACDFEIADDLKEMQQICDK